MRVRAHRRTLFVLGQVDDVAGQFVASAEPCRRRKILAVERVERNDRCGVRFLVAILFLAAMGCSHKGYGTDGSSVSFGPSRQGRVENPSDLPREGDGFWTPDRWKQRGLRYGTEELVSLVVYAGREVVRHAPGTKLSVADLSTRAGGRSRWHRSHQTGRDVDLLFVTKDEMGRPLLAETMRSFGEDGRATAGRAATRAPSEEDPRPHIYFDAQANWVVVRGLLDNPIAEVQYIFVADWLKQLLIDHAIEAGESEALIVRAGHILHQPGDSLPHDDHFHVRIYCSPRDLRMGCRDQGRLRWMKKGYKYRRKGLNSSTSRGLLQELPHASLGIPVGAMFLGRVGS